MKVRSIFDKNLQRRLLISSTLCIAGCYSSVRMSTPSIDEKLPGEMHDGLIVYLPRQAILTYKQTTFVGSDGKIHRECHPVLIDKVSLIPDTSKQYRVNFRAPILGSSKLNLELKDGMLTKLSTESDTKVPETIKAITESVGGFAALASKKNQSELDKLQTAQSKAPCNSGERLVAINGEKVTSYTE